MSTSEIVDEAAGDDQVSRPLFSGGIFAHPEAWGFKFAVRKLKFE